MPKRKFFTTAALVLSLLLLAGSLAGCTGTSGDDKSGNKNGADASAGQTASGSGSETDFPGSYTVPEGWVKADKYSTPDKLMYVEAGHENDEMPDNISIEVGTNKYNANEHEKFRDAIVQQLTMQLQGVDATLTGDGTYTKQNDILYIFTISEEDVVTKQYYIVGDKRYCLIHLTNFTGSENADNAAQAMADSFAWD